MRKCWLNIRWLLASLCLVTLALAAKVNSPLVGKWSARPDEDTRISYEFKADGSVFWTYQQGTVWSGITALYRLNDKVQPMQIDLYQFSDPDMQGVTLKGIFVLDSADQLRMVAARDARPENFDSGVVQFMREATTSNKSGK